MQIYKVHVPLLHQYQSYIVAFYFGFFNFSGFFQDPHTAVKGKCDFPPHSPQL